jgi:RNA polymerase sigma-70 factor (ECF subfamily)
MNNEASHISQGSSSPEADIPRLVERTQEGDSQAVATLYSLHYQRIYTFAYYRLDGNVPLAEDITEEAFMRAFRMIGTFQWKGVSFGAWVITIARNLIVDLLRRPEALPLQETWLDASLNPEKAVEQDITNKELAMALEKLTPDQKEVIILRFFEDFSIADTAKITGKSVDAVKRLQARALIMLESKLTSDES